MVPHLVPGIEGGYPERDGEEGEGGGEGGGEGLVLENSRSWMIDITVWMKLPFSICKNNTPWNLSNVWMLGWLIPFQISGKF